MLKYILVLYLHLPRLNATIQQYLWHLSSAQVSILIVSLAWIEQEEWRRCSLPIPQDEIVLGTVGTITDNIEVNELELDLCCWPHPHHPVTLSIGRILAWVAWRGQVAT